MTELLWEPLSGDPWDVPIIDAPYEKTPWQEKDLRFLAPMAYSANWSQMGCYKTSTALWLLERKKVRNALIITSKLGKGSYFSDFYRCLPENWRLYNLSIHGASMVKGGLEQAVDRDKLLEEIRAGWNDDPVILLAHYDMFTKRANLSSAKRAGGMMGILDQLRRINFDMLMCDEAHKLKNRKTQWTINIKKLRAQSKHIMTGTAFVNSPDEMWSLLNFLDKKRWRGYDEFKNYYCDQYYDARTGYLMIQGLLPYRVDEFRKLRQSLGPRHMMHTVHKDIEKPITTSHSVDLNPTQKRMYNEIKATLQTMDENGATLMTPNVISQLMRLRQVAVATPEVLDRHFDPVAQRMVYDLKLTEPSSKLDTTMEILNELDDPEQKVVVFSNFNDPLDLLQARLDKRDISYGRMLQKHDENERYRLWHDEFRRPDRKVFLSTLALGGESINLSCAQYIIFLDRSWSPAQMQQAIGRVYRPGQEGAVEVIYINANGTVDSYILSKLTRKEKWFDEIFAD